MTGCCWDKVKNEKNADEVKKSASSASFLPNMKEKNSIKANDIFKFTILILVNINFTL